MPYPLAVMPDDELAVIQYLRTITEVTTLVPATRITTALPPKPVYPAVLVQRAGGYSVFPNAIDEPSVQIDVVGGTKRECKVLTLTIRAAMLAIANETVSEGVLSAAVEEVGPSWLPDTIPDPPVSRYTARYRVTTHK